MPQSIRTWVVVADGAVAQLYVPNAKATALIGTSLPRLESAPVHRYTRDVNSDRPGRSFNSARGGLRHSYESRHDPHKMEKHNFTLAVAKALDRACAAKDFDQLVLVAPRRSVGEFRTLLSKRVQAKISKVIAKDMTKTSAAHLWPLVAGIVRHPMHAEAE